MSRGYQRAYLRAPFQGAVLFDDDGHVLKATAANLSEGGCLLQEIPQFPRETETRLMFSLPQFPLFKNFDLQKLRSFSLELFPAKIVRAHGHIARRREDATDVDEVFHPYVGVKFVEITPVDQRLIAEYVEHFAANLVHLQVLLDAWNTHDEIRLKARRLAQLLGYGESPKISELRARLQRDYSSLRWA
jgi:hypothetical protein